MERTVKTDVLRRLAHHNLYSHGGEYGGNNALACEAAMKVYGWDKPIWLTQKQIDNVSGKYAFDGLCVNYGEKPRASIVKPDHYNPCMKVRTEVYNIDQTNMAKVAPGAYALMSKGKSFDETMKILMHQPLIDRAMRTGQSTPDSFWRRLMGRS